MKTEFVYTEILSQTPVRDLAAIWNEGILKAVCPVVAQAVIQRTFSDNDATERQFDFVAYSQEEGAQPTKCQYSFPYDNYGACTIVPCSPDQWRRLFGDWDTVQAVAAELLGGQ